MMKSLLVFLGLFTAFQAPANSTASTTFLCFSAETRTLAGHLQAIDKILVDTVYVHADRDTQHADLISALRCLREHVAQVKTFEPLRVRHNLESNRQMEFLDYQMHLSYLDIEFNRLEYIFWQPCPKSNERGYRQRKSDIRYHVDRIRELIVRGVERYF